MGAGAGIARRIQVIDEGRFQHEIVLDSCFCMGCSRSTIIFAVTPCFVEAGCPQFAAPGDRRLFDHRGECLLCQ